MSGSIQRSRGASAYRRAAHAGTIPRNTALPVISGTAQVGQNLTVSNGTWAGNPATYHPQWYADDVVLAGEEAGTLELTADHLGAVIRCAIMAINSTGDISALSAPTAAVIAA